MSHNVFAAAAAAAAAAAPELSTVDSVTASSSTALVDGQLEGAEKYAAVGFADILAVLA